MKVVLINGSPRKKGNTYGLLTEAQNVIKSNDIDTEIIQIGGEVIRGCTACRKCKENLDLKCVIKDSFSPIIEKMLNADAIVLGSPTYFADITPELKALIDRCGVVSRANNMALSRKVGAGIVTARRAGAIHAFDSINHFFLISDMIVPGSTYWNVSKSAAIGDYENDEEAINTVKRMAENIAWLLKKIN